MSDRDDEDLPLGVAELLEAGREMATLLEEEVVQACGNSPPDCTGCPTCQPARSAILRWALAVGTLRKAWDVISGEVELEAACRHAEDLGEQLAAARSQIAALRMDAWPELHGLLESARAGEAMALEELALARDALRVIRRQLNLWRLTPLDPPGRVALVDLMQTATDGLGEDVQ